MPTLIPRKRVQGPSTTAGSTGAAIAGGLAKAGGALLGQVADQRFEAEQFEIKLQERRQTMDAHAAVTDKNAARIIANQEIRKNFDPEDYISEGTKWEEDYDDAQTKEQSEHFNQQYLQKDFTNRILGAKNLGSDMRRDVLGREQSFLTGEYRKAINSGSVEDFLAAGSESGSGGVLSDAYREEQRLFYGKQFVDSFVATAPEQQVIDELGNPDSELFKDFSPKQKQDYAEDVQKRKLNNFNKQEIGFTLSMSENINELYDMGYNRKGTRTEMMSYVTEVAGDDPARFQELSDVVNGIVKKPPTGSTTSGQTANRKVYEDELNLLSAVFNANTGGEVDESNLSQINDHSKQMTNLYNRMMVDLSEGNLNPSDVQRVRAEMNLKRIALQEAMRTGDTKADMRTVAGQGMSILSITGAAPGRSGLNTDELAEYSFRYIEALTSHEKAFEVIGSENEARQIANEVSDNVLRGMAQESGVQGEDNVDAYVSQFTNAAGSIATRSQVQAAANQIATSTEEAFEIAKNQNMTDEVARDVADKWVAPVTQPVIQHQTRDEFFDERQKALAFVEENTSFFELLFGFGKDTEKAKRDIKNIAKTGEPITIEDIKEFIDKLPRDEGNDRNRNLTGGRFR